MKKINFLVILLLGLGGCASLPSGPSCPSDLQVPGYFGAEVQRVAFEWQAAAHGYQLDGILQIKKQSNTSYEATLFARTGGMQILRANVNGGEISFSFIMKTADRAVIRKAVKRLLTTLLAAPQTVELCKKKGEMWRVRYAEEPHLLYEYPLRKKTPQQVHYRKLLGSSVLHFETVSNVGEMPLTQQLYYEDGNLRVKLGLMSVK